MAQWYENGGYEVVDRNWRCVGIGEIDVVARRGTVLVVCEVKTRSSESHGTALEAVGARKQERLRRATCDWLEVTATTCRVRFDVAAVTADVIEVIEGAF